MKIYGIYNVISNKTVRAHEKRYERIKRQNKYVLGNLVHTNRGYFIDGHQVDMAAVKDWKYYNERPENALPAYNAWQAELKRLKEIEDAKKKEAQESQNDNSSN